MYDAEAGNTILDYQVKVSELSDSDKMTVWREANYSLTGFEMILTRNVAK